MDFITVSVKCPAELIDLLIAEMFEAGFDSFQEFEEAFDASCDSALFNEEAIREILEKYPAVSYEIKEQDKVNWNKEWEKNYDPIIVEDKCLVRATFHKPEKDYQYEIVVDPKMSFGTGHHATTYQVLSYQMKLDHTDKSIADIGCGTGILAIMADKRGAKNITAIDIDSWCIENSRENFSLNNTVDVQLSEGQVDMLPDDSYDIVIANINKNVLLEQMKKYSTILKKGGKLLLSGFYQHDINDLIEEAKKWGLSKETETEKDKWAMLALSK